MLPVFYLTGTVKLDSSGYSWYEETVWVTHMNEVNLDIQEFRK